MVGKSAACEWESGGARQKVGGGCVWKRGQGEDGRLSLSEDEEESCRGFLVGGRRRMKEGGRVDDLPMEDGKDEERDLFREESDDVGVWW